MAPTSCGCGRCRSTITEDHRIGKEILDGRRRPVSQAAQHVPLSARRARRVQRGRAGRRRRGDARARALHARSCSRELDAKLRPGGRRLRLQHLRPRADRLLQRGSVGLLLRYPQGQPLLRRAGAIRSAAPIAPCSTRCSTRWSARPRRCWCSPPRKCGRRAIRTRTERAFARMARNCRRSARRAHAPNGRELRELRAHVTEAIEPLRRDKIDRLEPRGRGHRCPRCRCQPPTSPSCSSPRK